MHYEKITDKCVELGVNNPIIIQKMFGPTGFQDLRITARLDKDFQGWVIERFTNKGYIFWCLIPAQSDIDDYEDNSHPLGGAREEE